MPSPILLVCISYAPALTPLGFPNCWFQSSSLTVASSLLAPSEFQTSFQSSLPLPSVQRREPPPHSRLRSSPDLRAQCPPRVPSAVEFPSLSPQCPLPSRPLLTPLDNPLPVSPVPNALQHPEPYSLRRPLSLGVAGLLPPPHSADGPEPRSPTATRSPRATTLALVTRCVARLTTAKLPLPMVRSIS